MAGKYGCTWTHMICCQTCGCCKNCTNKCNFICGVYLHNIDKDEINTNPEPIENDSQEKLVL